MRNRKYKYLYQLICTGVVLIVVPVLLFYNIVWRESYNEICHLNNEYYNKVLTAFYAAFTDKVSEVKNQVNTFSVNSRSDLEESGIFFYGTKKMEEKNYYYGEAVNELHQYGLKMGADGLGIYYYDKDVVLADRTIYSSNRYIKDGLLIEDDRSERLKVFFSKERYDNRKVIVAALYDDEGKSEKLLVGVGTILGKNKEQALMFCTISYKDIDLFNATSLDRAQEKYYVLDNVTQDILFSIHAEKEDYDSLLSKVERNAGTLELTATKNLYVKQHNEMTFIVDVSEDEVQNNVTRFYQDMKLFMVYITLIMIAICFGTVYVNYKPMYELLRKINRGDKGEFETLLHTWEEQKDLLSEQRITIIDLLMNHLLYGIPISYKNMKKIGVSSRITHYCVFLISNYVLKVSEVEDITDKIEEQFGTLLFATDLTEEKSMIIIAFMEHDRSKEVKLWLEDWCRNNITDEYQLKNGCVVDKVNEIKTSFEDCLKCKGVRENAGHMIGKDQSVSQKVRSGVVLNEKLKEKMLNYVDANFTDKDLCQQKLADYFHVSIYSVSKMFNNQIGTGFSGYVNGKRMDYAKELLRSTENSVKEIAIEVGMPDDSYFAKIFKKYTGVTPIEFRDSTTYK